MNIQKVDNTNFTAIKCKPSESSLRSYMFEKLNSEQYMQMESLIYSQRENPIDIYISVTNKNGKRWLEAEIGPKTFKESFFQSGLKVIKKSVKYANKLYTEKENNARILKDFQSPKLDI